MASIPPDMQSLLEKMMLAGWVSSMAVQEKTEEGGLAGIKWTRDGIARLAIIAACIAEIEAKGHQISNGEMAHLKGLAQLIAMTHPIPTLPKSDPPNPHSRF